MTDQTPQDFAAIERAHDQPPDEPYGHDNYDSDETGEDCGSCGANIGPSSDYPWHYVDEDCRAVRRPLVKP